MPTVGDMAAKVLKQLAPLALAEEWDNVGLLVGDEQWPADRVMTCLTVARQRCRKRSIAPPQLDRLAFSPFPSTPIRTITPATTVGRAGYCSISSAIRSPSTVPTRHFIPLRPASINTWRSV